MNRKVSTYKATMKGNDGTAVPSAKHSEAEALMASTLLKIRTGSASGYGGSSPLAMGRFTLPSESPTLTCASGGALCGDASRPGHASTGLFAYDPAIVLQLQQWRQQQQNSSFGGIPLSAIQAAAASSVPLMGNLNQSKTSYTENSLLASGLFRKRLLEQASAGLNPISSPTQCLQPASDLTSHQQFLQQKYESLTKATLKTLVAQEKQKIAEKESAAANEAAAHQKQLEEAERETSQAEQDRKAQAAEADRIRKEEVEAALRSAPQRGRKRENLSELERMELTRTRNREHAKTTRIRKKQRYEELLQNEKRLVSYRENYETNERRRLCLIDFLAVRGNMLGNTPSPGVSALSKKKEDQKETILLEDVIEDISSFSYQDGNDRSEGLIAFARMKAFDDAIVSHVTARFGKSASSKVSYQVKGSNEKIAFDLKDSGLAEVVIVYEDSGTEPVMLMTRLMRFEFAPDSDKLRSVTWVTLSSLAPDACVTP